MVISQLCRVKLHYTVSLGSGEVLESTNEAEPLEFVFGNGEIISGLERGLEGMAAGEEKHIVVPPEEAYGVHNPEAVVSVPREEFQTGGELEPGMLFRLRREDGMVMHVKVISANDDEVSLDLNHPLAGEELHFDVKVEDVATPD